MRPVAAFDFDGTLTRADSLYPFLCRVVGRPRLAAAALADLPRIALAAVGRGDRDAAKARLFRRVLEGRDAEAIRSHGAAHAANLVAHEIRPELRDRIAWHRSEGHELVIVSASLDVYLDVVGPELGFDHVVCTRLEVVDGRLTGAMLGGNCRGPAKVERLRAAVPDVDSRELWAYGDSAGDRELLAAAQHPVKVTRRPPHLPSVR